MQIDSLALQMRPRAPHEAADLGVRLCQTTARRGVSLLSGGGDSDGLLSLSLFEVSPWLPSLVMWWSKPWLDRSVLFVLARAAFGQQTTVADLWHEQREVWWRRFLLTWTWRRLSPWRSFTEPVYQLEGHGLFQLRRRVLQLRRRHSGAAYMMTLAFTFAELGIAMGLLSLVFWFGSPGEDFDFEESLQRRVARHGAVAGIDRLPARPCCSSSPSMSRPDSACISTGAPSSKPGTSSRNSVVPSLRTLLLCLLLGAAHARAAGD